jgi:hypothetical protein
VGGEVLVGLALGILGTYVTHLVPLQFIEKFAPQLMPHASAFFSLWCWITIASVGTGLTSAFVKNVLLLLVRRQWLAVSIFVIVMTVAVGSGYPLVAATARSVFLFLMIAYALMKFGVLAAVAFIYVHNLILAFPLTTNLSVWYAPAAMFAIASVLALTIYAFHVTAARQRFWKDSLDSL